ncbi:hypothetical protein ACFL2G_05395 [Candidatus Omnitrophota bacterium]
MIERIILLAQHRFTLRDYQRLGVEILKRNGFKVEVWDMEDILYPHLLKAAVSRNSYNYEGLRIFYSKKYARRKLTALSDKDFVMTSVGYNFKTLWIYKAMSRSNANYAVRYISALPISCIKKSLLERVRYLLGFRRLDAWKALFMKLPFCYLGVRPATFIICGGNNWHQHKYYHRFPVDKSTEILRAHTLDYDIYLKKKNTSSDVRPIAAFLDEFVPYHPDQLRFGLGHKVNAEKYYSLLNRERNWF